jgi:hypothetical protein
MKKIIKFLRKACWKCHGMSVIELPNGDTIVCNICKGKGML